MNNKIKLISIAIVIVLAVAALWGGIAFAQSTFSHMGYGWMMWGNRQTGYSGMMGGRGGMMSGYAQGGADWEWMNSMHQWMTTNGGMHTFIWNALAEKLGLTSDELYSEINNGKTIAQIAEENNVSRADLVAALETAHKDSLAQAVKDEVLTQEQADNMLNQMAGRYEWMLDNMGNGGMMSGAYAAGGMMNGQYGAGGCHGNWNGSNADQQPKP